MAAEYTPNVGLYKPNRNDEVEVDKSLADNFQKIDDEFNSHAAQLADIAYTNVNAHSGTDTQKLNAFLSANGGKTVRIPRGNYTVDATIFIPDNTIIEAEGVKITSSNHISILSVGSGVRINGIELIGAGNSVYNSSGIGISFKGLYNTSAVYKTNLKLENCKLKNLSCYGIYLEYAQDVKIVNCNIENVGYAGIMGMSVKDVSVSQKTTVKNVSPGTSNNMYGIAFTRFNASADFNQYPRSENCVVIDCVIDNVPIWEALDTHGGNNIKFLNNTIRNCKMGIAIVGSETTISPNYCEVTGNIIYGKSGGTGPGIVVKGSPNTAGNPYSYAESCIVRGNTLIDCGLEGSSENGAIMFEETRNIVVTGNVIEHAYGNGINCYMNNQGFAITGNTVIDPQSSSITTVSGITVRAGYSKGYIGDNALLRVNDGYNTNVAERGIWIGSQNSIEIVLGSNYNNYVIEQSGTIGQYVKRSTLYNGISEYIGSGTPEAIITANVGSKYTDITSGKLYVKETGTGNTGWVMK
jgi:Right handed beta helix region